MKLSPAKNIHVEFFPKHVTLTPERIRKGHLWNAWVSGIATVVLTPVSTWAAYRGKDVWPFFAVMTAMQALLFIVSVRRARA
jgi:hypothetical protein